MLPGSRPVGVRLVAAVVAAERAGRLGQQPRRCRWTWLTCAVDVDRAGPDVSGQQGQCIHRVSAPTCSGEPAASLLAIACARDGYALLVAVYDSW